MKTMKNKEAVRKALEAFISTVNCTGGVIKDRDGFHSPVAAQDWIDLGAAYMGACEALGIPIKEVK